MHYFYETSPLTSQALHTGTSKPYFLENLSSIQLGHQPVHDALLVYAHEQL